MLKFLNQNKRRKVCNIFLLLFLIFSFKSSLKAQSFSVGGIQDIKSPQASALIRVAMVPTQLNTGQINPKIKIYDFVTPELTLPIELNYSNTGLKVDEIPTWVGHGWTLEMGGVISQSVRGISDFSVNGMQNPAVYNDMVRCLNNTMGYWESITYKEAVCNSEKDSERDLFTFNFLGRSGSFFIDVNNKIQQFSKSDLKIEANFSSYDLTSFIVTDEIGYKYFFSIKEASSVSQNNPATSNYPIVINSYSWYLDKIITSGNDEFIFNYNSFGTYNLQGNSQSISFGATGNSSGCSVNYSLNGYSFGDYFQSFSVKQLSLITSKYGSIQFNTSLVREDLTLINGTNNNLSGPALSQIHVYDANDRLIKKVELSFGKFIAGQGHNRLKLSTLKVHNNVNNGLSELYQFKYYNEDDYFPQIGLSKDFDHWGYYNGANNIYTVPNFGVGIHPLNAVYSSGANKNANSYFSRFGMIKEIEYPNGGSVEFQYEPNVVDISNNPSLNSNPFFDFTSSLASNFQVGGNRIKKVIYKDKVSSVNNEIEYDYSIENSIKNVPNYLLTQNFLNYNEFWVNDCGITNTINDKPLNSMPGFQIEYSSVIERNSNNFNGKIKYSFLKGEYIGSQYFPFSPVIHQSWISGVVSKQETFKIDNNSQSKKIKEENIGYNNSNYLPMTLTTTSLKIVNNSTGNGRSPSYSNYVTGIYSYFTDFFVKNTNQTIDFDGSNQLTNQSNYFYESNNHSQKTRETRINSKGELSEIKYYYVPDFSNSINSISSLKSKGFVSLIRQDILKNSLLVNSKFNELNNNGFITKSKESVISNPITIGSFDNSNFGQYGIVYKEKSNHYYNSSNKLIESKFTNGINSSYLYDYNNFYPMAQVTNASFSSIAYTSFEADGKGNWDYTGNINLTEAITGNKSYYLSTGYIERTALNANTTYTITYWVKNGSGSVSLGGSAILNKNGWTLYETFITGITALTISGSAIIDELRMYPKGAQMTTYTYLPLIGISSQADVNNRITYYEYDGFNRLKLIRDMDKNIIKKFDYQYQQSQY